MKLYKITNEINGKIYIGVTKRELSVRFKEHKSESSGCIFLRNAIQKYGFENFSISLIKEGGFEEIALLEKQYVEELMLTDRENCYNLVIPSGNHGGFIFDDLRLESLRLARGDPVYIMGFWFPSKKYAARILGLTRTVINDYINNGFTDDYDTSSVMKYRAMKSNRRGHGNIEVTLDGKHYRSLMEAQISTGIDKRYIRSYLSQNEYTDIHEYIRYRKDKKSETASNSRKRKVICKGKTYESLGEFLKATGMTTYTFYKHLNDPNNTDFEYLNNEET